MMDKLEQFFKEEYDTLVGRINFRVRNMDDAEDIVMDAFRKAVEYWSSFDPTHKEIGAWFNTIMNNSHKTFQKEKFMKHIEMEHDIDIPVEDNYDVKDIAEKIKEEFSSSDNLEIRDALHLFFVLGYNYKDIQTVTGISVRNARFYVDEFKKEMRDKYGEDMK